MSAVSAILLPFRLAFIVALLLVQLFVGLWFLYAAYDIRMYSIKEFGMIIHEFDPWFNYRAAEYLCEHGLSKFFKWYDYMSWYPIGRPVGTTIYPGMQMTAYGIREAMLRIPAFTYEIPRNPVLRTLRQIIKAMTDYGFTGLPVLQRKIVYAPMSVNDICCMIPPWFGSIAALFTGLLAYEITRSTNAGVAAMGIMAVIPAHLMRSVGGEFDNEAVAMAAISSTFWLWIRSVRTPKSWPWGILAGISYIYMVLAWGGYIFVINAIGVHALLLVALGRFNSGVYKAYTLFYVIGVSGAVQIPVVGWQPIRSLEQLGPLLVFLGYQVLAFCDHERRRKKMSTKEFVVFRIKVCAAFLGALAITCCLLYPTGYFGPFSARIRGLFVKHTKTGNPLVDSVAEHQPASKGIYASYLNLPLDYGMHGAAVCLYHRTNGCWFAAIYAAVAIHFSGKMSRLVLICAPICTVGAAIWLGFLLDMILQPVLLLLGKQGYKHDEVDAPEGKDGEAQSPKAAKDGAKGKEVRDRQGTPNPKAKEKDSAKAKDKASEKPKGKKQTIKKPVRELREWEEEDRPGGMMMLIQGAKDYYMELIPKGVREGYREQRVFFDSSPVALGIRLVISAYIVWSLVAMRPKVSTFVQHCHQVARSLSNPKVVTKIHDRVKGPILMDDYYAGYKWIDANTPKDSRVIAWWDYGYQITGIAKRTSIADGNTWNHEHIATLGRTLTSPEKKAWNAIRHLADYVMVWAGGGGDDLGKSPHLARIGNSVYPDHCGDEDPRCTKFSFFSDGSPTPMMAKSLLYKAVKHNLAPGVKLDPKYFQEVHTTKYGKMRIYKVMNVSQESKDWIADPNNRVCDAPGSWYCVGQYPPALSKLISMRRNFAQVEDFNRGGQKSAYTRMIEKERGGRGEL
mmetsp:Transcript_24548/g.70471  ORF Transcript_24548/g.70471 Transcript_24548/m.70471 type:complete len:903 (+) Transcript_24548:58-2766(+)